MMKSSTIKAGTHNPTIGLLRQTPNMITARSRPMRRSGILSAIFRTTGRQVIHSLALSLFAVTHWINQPPPCGQRLGPSLLSALCAYGMAWIHLPAKAVHPFIVCLIKGVVMFMVRIPTEPASSQTLGIAQPVLRTALPIILRCGSLLFTRSLLTT